MTLMMLFIYFLATYFASFVLLSLKNYITLGLKNEKFVVSTNSV